MIENQPNELTIIYHAEKADDKKARAYAESVTNYKVKTIDLSKESITETQLAEIATKMGVDVSFLLDKTYLDRLAKPRAKLAPGFDDHDLLTVLTQEKILLKTPIAIIGKKAFLFKSSNDFLLNTTSTDGLHHVSKANVEEKRMVF
jgi:arsenate reductase-like glutaredoxin family protein